MNRNLLIAALIFGLVLTLIGFFLIFKVYQAETYFVDHNRNKNSNFNADFDLNGKSSQVKDKNSTDLKPNDRKDGYHHRSEDEHHRRDGYHHRSEDEHHRRDGYHHRSEDEHHRRDGYHHRSEDEHHRRDGYHHRSEDEHHRRDGYHHRRGSQNQHYRDNYYNNTNYAKAHHRTNLVPLLDMFSKKSSSEKNKQNQSQEELKGALPISKSQDKEEILKRGKKVFQQNCFSCHSTLKKEDRIFYPSLEEMKSHQFEKFKEIVQKGIPGTAMIPRGIDEKDVEAIYLWLNQLNYK